MTLQCVKIEEFFDVLLYFQKRAVCFKSLSHQSAYLNCSKPELNYLQFYSLLMDSWASFFPCVQVDWLNVEKLRYMEFRTYFSYNKLYIICFVNPPFIQCESRMKFSLSEFFFVDFYVTVSLFWSTWDQIGLYAVH